MPSSDSARRSSPDHLRLLARVARMYHESGVKQQDIADELSISQARVSRLLKEAVERGIVRSIVVLPDGLHTDLEERVRAKFGLRDVVVVDAAGASDVSRALGSGAAAYLDSSLTGGDVIGVSSWSGTLGAAVDAMRPRSTPAATHVVQMFGGVGNPEVQVQAHRLTERLAEVTRAVPVFVPSPSVVGTMSARKAMLSDPGVVAAAEVWKQVTVSLAGIGSLDPSPLLRRSGNAVSAADAEDLQGLGAVGDVCLRYFDRDGRPVASDFDGRVVGMTAADLLAVPRRIGVAGGLDKLTAIRAALAGGWLSVLITDDAVATALVE